MVSRIRAGAMLLMVAVFMLSGCVVIRRGPHIHFYKTAPQKSAAQNAAISELNIGVILLAHGSGEEWNAAVVEAFEKIGGNYKKEIVFGMGNAADIQKSVDRLQASGVRAIVVVPLFLSSHSEMYRHLEYVLGVRDEPDVLFWFLMGRHTAESGEGHGGHGSSGSFFEQVRFSVPYRVASPVNYDGIVADILVERLTGVGREASVFLLAHGPITAEDDLEWHRDLSRYAQHLARAFPGVRFFGMTFRDDAPPFIRDAAIRRIQDAVRREIAEGRRVVVFPFLLAPGGREAEITTMLKGYEYRSISRAILPHPAISRYITEKIEKERMFFAPSR
jgi:sirohydrochlorin cobaltochelatase